MDLCVTKLSGVGADCIFLGLIRPVTTSATNVRIWVSPSGHVLCCDQVRLAATCEGRQANAFEQFDAV